MSRTGTTFKDSRQLREFRSSLRCFHEGITSPTSEQSANVGILQWSGQLEQSDRVPFGQFVRFHFNSMFSLLSAGLFPLCTLLCTFVLQWSSVLTIVRAFGSILVRPCRYRPSLLALRIMESFFTVARQLAERAVPAHSRRSVP